MPFLCLFCAFFGVCLGTETALGNATCLMREREARFTSEELLKTNARADTRAETEQRKSRRRAAEEKQESRERAETRLELKSTSVGSAVGSESC